MRVLLVLFLVFTTVSAQAEVQAEAAKTIVQEAGSGGYSSLQAAAIGAAIGAVLSLAAIPHLYEHYTKKPITCTDQGMSTRNLGLAQGAIFWSYVASKSSLFLSAKFSRWDAWDTYVFETFGK